MIKQIYKIIKPADPMTIYIGSTEDLELRFTKHKNKTLKCLVNWLDETCKIVPIEEREIPGTEIETRGVFQLIEFEWISKLELEGFKCLNILNGKSKAIGFKKNTKCNANRTKEYVNWCSAIYYAAKKEGLTSKEYRAKHNLEFLGLKKLK